MRLFIAVNFPDEVKKTILDVQEQLCLQTVRGSFTRPENLHLTLAFLGETPEEKLPCLFKIMEKIQPSPFEVIFNYTGYFSHSHKELWWIGADKCSPGISMLDSIHAQLLTELPDAGFSVDKRPYNAHITLGREIKHSSPITLECPEIKVAVHNVSLMKSERIRGILTYTELFKESELKNP